MSIFEGGRPNVKLRIALLLVGGLLFVCAFGFFIASQESKEPFAQRVNDACRTHKGVRQIFSHAGPVVVCIDGTAVQIR